MPAVLPGVMQLMKFSYRYIVLIIYLSLPKVLHLHVGMGEI